MAGASDRLVDLAADIKIGMLTTTAIDGTLVSRPMAQQEVQDDGTLWLFAERGSRKTDHVAANPHVNLTLTSNDTWISIDGTAEVVVDRDKARELWNPFVEAWMPEGPDDEDVVLIKVTPSSGEYWDTPGSRIASALAFVKAKATGQRPDVGENERVDL